MKSPTVKLKKCRLCKEKFQPFNTMQAYCGPECALAAVRKESAMQARKEKVEYRKANKTKPELVKDAQAACNAYIRERDRDLPCISCGTFGGSEALTGGYWDCGHYRSIGSAPELRFEPLNMAKQCKRCNRQLGGNIVEYRKGLLQRIGAELLEWLEGPHDPKHYTHAELREIAEHYRALTRSLKKAANDDDFPTNDAEIA